MMEHELELAEELKRINPEEDWIVYTYRDTENRYNYSLLLEGMRNCLFVTDDIDELKDYVYNFHQ